MVNLNCILFFSFFFLTLLLKSHTESLSEIYSKQFESIKPNVSYAYEASLKTINTEFFVPYLLELERNQSVDPNRFKKECQERPKQITYFHEVVYDVFCKKLYNRLSCDQKSRYLVCTIKFLKTNDLKLFDVGNQSDGERFYEEVISEDVPFCTATICPLIKSNKILLSKDDQSIAFLDCMPIWCKVGFYIIFWTDLILALLIAFPNVFVLYTGLKHNCFTTPGG